MRKITLFIAVILCCAACNNEIEVPVEPEETGQQLELFVPDAAEVNVYSAATVSECMIDSMWVCVFDNTRKKRFVEKIKGDQIMHNGQARQLLPQLKQKINNGDIVVCIANANVLDTVNITPDNINSKISAKRLAYLGGNSLPMYGEIESWSSAGAYTCRMTRAVAKIQVQLGASFEALDIFPDLNPFNEKQALWRIANTPQYVYIQPKSTPAGRPSASGTIFYNPTDQSNLSSVFLQREGATAILTTVYVYEMQSSIHKVNDTINPIDKTKFDAARPCIIVSYYPGGSNRNNRFYRLDFYDHAKKEYIDILRNHHYLFTINRVGSEGYGGYENYGSMEEVLNNPPSNIEYTVYVNDNSRSITSNGQYAVVTNVDTVWLTGDVTDQTVATYRYINPTGTPLTILTDTIYVRPSYLNKPSGATLTITSPPMYPLPISATGGTANHELKITTSGNLDSTVIHFRFGGIHHYLPVRKRP
ncbi:MAG: hypothetical protein LBD80_04380 [Tannerella sp.]|nr:hypothetical protein [Tannerella sp.]